MKIPPLAPWPTPNIREEQSSSDWQELLEAWINVTEVHLKKTKRDFTSSAEDNSLINFLESYIKSTGHIKSGSPGEHHLHKNCFLLVHRLLIETQNTPLQFFKWTFLADLSRTYSSFKKPLHSLLLQLWKSKSSEIEPDLSKLKNRIISLLDKASEDMFGPILAELQPLVFASPDIGSFFMVGSDFLDSMTSSYPKTSSNQQQRMLTTVFLCLMSLLKVEHPHVPLLLDHIYSLKSSTEPQKGSQRTNNSLLSDLVTNTPLTSLIHHHIKGNGAGRAESLLTSLEDFRTGPMPRPVKRKKPILDKGKSRVDPNEAVEHVHIHQMSLITQVQDLFPDLGSGFITKLLDEYNDNAELVTAHLLDDDLPPHLLSLDRTEQLSQSSSHSHMVPHSTPPLIPVRHNIFDNDELDTLTLSTDRLHIGRKNASRTAGDVLADRSSAPGKAAILSALAAFDSDDDERDDTYDAEDVGGTVDAGIASSAQDEADTDLVNEEALFASYRTSPDVFLRDAATRRSKARAALKTDTGMTDEAIEGWGIMIGRDPRALRRLEAKYAFRGGQQDLTPTAWRGTVEGSAGEESEGGGRGRGKGRGGGRAPGRGGRGRGRAGGSVAGPSNEPGTQANRQKKEANKGSRANHNRRDRRAKKMARGGFPG